jgi:hypothetical protein
VIKFDVGLTFVIGAVDCPSAGLAIDLLHAVGSRSEHIVHSFPSRI